MVGLGLLSVLDDPIQPYLLLVMYNALFVTPLIVIIFAILTSSRYVRKIKAIRNKKLGIMELISGSLLVVLCIYLLLSS